LEAHINAVFSDERMLKARE